jgi:hypothetical protein
MVMDAPTTTNESPNDGIPGGYLDVSGAGIEPPNQIEDDDELYENAEPQMEMNAPSTDNEMAALPSTLIVEQPRLESCNELGGEQEVYNNAPDAEPAKGRERTKQENTTEVFDGFDAEDEAALVCTSHLKTKRECLELKEPSSEYCKKHTCGENTCTILKSSKVTFCYLHA